MIRAIAEIDRKRIVENVIYTSLSAEKKNNARHHNIIDQRENVNSTVKPSYM